MNPCRVAAVFIAIALVALPASVQAAGAKTASAALACPVGNGAPGGYTALNATGPLNQEALAVAYEAFEGALAGNISDSCNWNTAIITVNDACSQVVAGTNYIFGATIDLCGQTANGTAKVFVPLPSANAAPELAQVETTGWKKQSPDSLSCAARVGDGNLMGGFRTVPAGDYDAAMYAALAEGAAALKEDLYDGSAVAEDCNWDNVVVEINDVCTQIVAGQNWIFDLTLDLPDCEIKANAAVEVFMPLPSANEAPVIVGTQVGTWESYAKNKYLSCAAVVGNGERPGGFSRVSPDSPELDAVVAAVDALINQTVIFDGRCQGDAFDISLQDACSQVVAGTNFLVDFEVSIPDCGVSSNASALVFVPLPSANEDVQVVELNIKDLVT